MVGTPSKSRSVPSSSDHMRLGITLVTYSTTFENVPSDYSILKLVQIPEDAGGDTLWASGYEAYDRLSPALQQFVEGLTAVHYQRNFSEIKTRYGEDKLISPRGHPENSGFEFQAEQCVVGNARHIHQSVVDLADTPRSPVVRTNPVTGWKSLFAVAHQMEAGWFTGLTERESDIFKDYCKSRNEFQYPANMQSDMLSISPLSHCREP